MNIFHLLVVDVFLMQITQGVSIGGGIGSINDTVDAAKMICEKVGLLLPLTYCMEKIHPKPCFIFITTS